MTSLTALAEEVGIDVGERERRQVRESLEELRDEGVVRVTGTGWSAR